MKNKMARNPDRITTRGIFSSKFLKSRTLRLIINQTLREINFSRSMFRKLFLEKTYHYRTDLLKTYETGKLPIFGY